MKRIALTITAVFTVVLAACASGAGSSGAPAGSGGTDDGGAIDHPISGDEAIFTIESAGGFVPPQFVATQMPSFVLLGDGRVIMQGAQTLQFPGPALPALQERTLTEAGIQDVLRAIGETNLFTSDRRLDGAQAMVADASDTVFTLRAAGLDVTVSVYGLGALASAPDMPRPEGITAAEIEAHGVLQQLNDQMLMLETWLPADAWETEGWQPYEPEAFRLYVRDVTDQPVDPGNPPQQELEWPTETDPATFGEEAGFNDGTRCGVVEGADAETWLARLNTANQLTLWTPADAPDSRFSVIARPILPHEEAACPPPLGT
jgi:hypothetical protein